ncbi:phospholipid/cholesterol/gamma-HCH transport system substrate-binding protein [Pleomorphomonas diazotrophica]|nr:MlaD family protein [Pleomorphomonas diazotrophica]SFM48117.1 phospholipid/cholesterol/gamma-HCH transport system substrate-binding protein [Pleomorphomonas diazotrophica]
MESRANYAVIGGFVLVMLTVALAFLGWLGNAGESQRQAEVRVVFSGAVTGLSTGSAVLFNGIKIGEVRELRLDEKDPRTVIALIRVNRDVPLKTDTRAMLSYQGLTGAATLQLEGGSRNAPGLFDAAPDGMPTMLGEISPFQDILESARNVLTRADSAMAAIDDFITENGPAFNRTVNNVEKFSAALADNSDNISKAMVSISSAADSIGQIAQDLKGAAAQVTRILDAVDPKRVTEITERLAKSSEQLNAVLERANVIAEGIDPATVNGVVQNVADAARTLDETIAQAKTILGAVDPQEVDRLVASLTETSDELRATAARADALLAAVDTDKVRSVVSAVDTASQNIAAASGSLGMVVEDTRQTLGAARSVVEAVDPAKIRSTVTDVSDFAAMLKSYKPQIDSIMADVNRASASLANLGDTIDARTPDVDRIVRDTRTLAEQLNGIAARADGILQKVDGYVTGDGQGLVAEATAAAKSIREVADKLNQQVGPIADNVSKFSSRGLDSVVALADQGRQALARLDRVLQGVERNPQQFIFGGQGVPEYAPRR